LKGQKGEKASSEQAASSSPSARFITFTFYLLPFSFIVFPELLDPFPVNPYNKPASKRRPAMFGSLGIWEILLIVVVIALLFGGKKLPELGKGLGQGIKNFKNAVKGEEKSKDDGRDEKGN
jgi:sec-independent protein translocase protein TatA